MGRDETLPSGQRVRRRSQYLAIQNRGRKLHTNSFLVFVLARSAADLPTRLGITVSKRVGNAVIRNRVKRRVREAFRRHKMLFPSGLDVVFIAKRNAGAMEYEQVAREMRRLCEKPLAP